MRVRQYGSEDDPARHVRHPSLLATGCVVAMVLSGESSALLAQQTSMPPQPPLFRSVDGFGTNPIHAAWGSAGHVLRRVAPVAYADGLDAPAGSSRPSARLISNALCAQANDHLNTVGATDFVWQWGQFLDHDITLTEGADPAESFAISVPANDAWFDPFGTGAEVIGLNRSHYLYASDGVRQQINDITAFIDGSQIYGSSEATARSLRAADGLMLTSAGDLLPLDADGFFLAGDIRVNEQVGLIAMHTLFVREHNRIASLVRTAGFDADTTWLLTRAIVGAELQAITYREFLPILLGKDALRPYAGYQPNVDPSMANEFSNAAYRLGHSMLSPNLLRLDSDNQEIGAGHLALRDAFFAPHEVASHGIDSLLRGLAAQQAQDIDTLIIDDVRNFLFGPPGAGGFDLASLNVQRGRDHGLASYVETCQAYGLAVPHSFADITNDHDLRQALHATYGSVDAVDLWIGGLAERHVPGTMVGPLLRRMLVEQFERLRDGDPYWYQRSLPSNIVTYVESMTLAEIIRANTRVGEELSSDVFRVPANGGRHGRGRGQRGHHNRGAGDTRVLSGRSLQQARRMR